MKINSLIKKYVISIICVIAFIIGIIINIKIEDGINVETTEKVPIIEVKEIIEDENIVDKIDIKYDWQITIPKIGVIAPIKEGSSAIVLSKNVGHISGTGILNGNIVLAGHNNTANYSTGIYYFDKLDELEIGDRIYYRVNNNDFKFSVTEIKEVNEKDLSVLQNSNITKLTLITCIEGKRNSRLVITANQNY